MLRNSNRCNASLQTVKKSASVYSQAGGNNQSQRNSTSQSSAGDGQPKKGEDSNHENESDEDEINTDSEVNRRHFLEC